jgi:hypothetical protein
MPRIDGTIGDEALASRRSSISLRRMRGLNGDAVNAQYAA